MTDRVGQQLGNYQLIRLLGEGGFAEVYLGEHIHLGTQAAIKVLHTQLTSDDVDKFRTEARTIAHLIHPHIVRVLEFGVEGKTPFLVMDYAPNGTLRHRHPKGVALPLPLIVAYIKQIADALQYSHDEKLIHRDIKPENMLLGRRNDILLSDFGIALVAQSSRYQSAQEMAGTIAYMAPEQIQGKARPASDQYSLGIVVYEWLSGDRPFHGSLTELVGQHLSVPPPSLQEKISMILPEVDQVVLTALAKDPKQRFESIQTFATALEQASQSVQPASSVIASPLSHLPEPNIGDPSARQPTSPPDRIEAILPEPSPLPTNVIIPQSQSSQSTDVVTPPSQSLQPTNVITPSSSLSQATVATMPSHPPDMSLPPTKEAVPFRGIQPPKGRISRRAVLVGLAGLAVVGGGLTWLALSHPSFRPVARSASTATPNPTPTATPSPTPIAASSPVPLGTTLFIYHGHTSQVNAVGWSPDGGRIASGSLDATVQVWDAISGNRLLTYSTGQVACVSWSPDGKRIASGGYDNIVSVWDATTGSTTLTHSGPSLNSMLAVAWSPDGKHIASGNNDSTVQVWDATTGSTILTYKDHSASVLAIAWSPDGMRIASGSVDRTVQVWDTTTGKRLVTYRQHSNWVTAVAWSPDSKQIVSGSADKTVQIWDSTTGNTLLIYQGHSKLAQASDIGVFAIAWSPNGKRIASGGADKTVQVWDAADGSHVFIYRGHSNPVTTVAWSPDGRRIASGSWGNTVQVWQAV